MGLLALPFGGMSKIVISTSDSAILLDLEEKKVVKVLSHNIKSG